MIYTVTFNPSLDYVVTVENFEMGKTNRTKDEYMIPGGKGINVSLMLNNLGYHNVALGFTAGFTGDEISKILKEKGCDIDFIKVEKGFSRVNVKVKNDTITEINGTGPVLDTGYIGRLLSRIDQLKDGDVLVLAGSIPASADKEIYGRRAQDRQR